MKKMIQRLHKDEDGSYFIEMSLVLIGVAFVVFSSALGLSNDGIIPKYDNIRIEIQSVLVPDL